MKTLTESQQAYVESNHLLAEEVLKALEYSVQYLRESGFNVNVDTHRGIAEVQHEI